LKVRFFKNNGKTTKYLFVGSLNTLINFLVFKLFLIVFGLPLLIAASSGFITGISISYLLNSKYTFKTKKVSKKQFLFFIISQFIILQTFNFLLHISHNILNIDQNIAWFLSTLFVAFLNYKMQKWLFVKII
jgi:putative flippase GtrA